MQNKIKNPLFYEENREAAHSDHKYYVSKSEFVQQIQSLKKTLDGVWKFHRMASTKMIQTAEAGRTFMYRRTYS